MVDGTRQTKGSAVLPSATTQPYLRSVPAVTWYSACVSIWVALEGSRPENWSYLTAPDALVQLFTVAFLSVLKVHVLRRKCGATMQPAQRTAARQ